MYGTHAKNRHRVTFEHLSNINPALYRGAYMSAHVLLDLLSELANKDKMRGLLSILVLFRNEFNKFIQ